MALKRAVVLCVEVVHWTKCLLLRRLLGGLLRWLLGCLLGRLRLLGLGGLRLLRCLGLLGLGCLRLLGSLCLLRLLGFLRLGLLRLLCLLHLLLLVSDAEGSRGSSSLDLFQLSVGDGLLQVAADERGQLCHVALVVGGDVFLDGSEGRSLAVLQVLDGGVDHGSDGRVRRRLLGLLRLGRLLLGRSGSSVRHSGRLQVELLSRTSPAGVMRTTQTAR